MVWPRQDMLKGALVELPKLVFEGRCKQSSSNMILNFQTTKKGTLPVISFYMAPQILGGPRPCMGQSEQRLGVWKWGTPTDILITGSLDWHR